MSATSEITIRTHRSGDLGWLLHRHAILNQAQFGWGQAHEADLALIMAEFLKRADPSERFWVAEREGRIVGCVALMHDRRPNAARLRLLFVEPSMRGAGLGERLVRLCVDQARALGCDQLVLWTLSANETAKRLYAREGFELIATEPHTDYGEPLTGETWRLTL